MNEQKIRLALVTTVIDGRKGRGTASVAQEWLSRILENDEFEITLIHHETDSNPLYQKYPTLVIPHLPRLLDRHIFREIWFWFKLRANGTKFDIVHYLQPRVWPSYLFTNSKKIIVTPHDAGVMCELGESSPAQFWFRLTNRFLNQRMDAIIAVSDYAKQEISTHYHIPLSRIFVVYNALPAAFTEQQLTKPNSFTPPSPYILSVGRFDPHKNIHRMIEAYAQARKKGLEEFLVLVGGAHHPAYTKKVRDTIKQLGLTDSVFEAPYIPDTYLPTVYKNATAVIYPSLHEGFGLPLLEAMACGTPVAAADATALPEIANNAALLFKPDDVDQITDAILNITTDNDLREVLIKKGYERIKNFSWDKSATTIIKLYQSLSPSTTTTDMNESSQ